MLSVLETHGEWAKISFAGKAAWSLVSNLSSDKPPERFDIGPYLRNPTPWYETIAKSEDLNVEFGPRGGKFVRTKKGFRRYF